MASQKRRGQILILLAAWLCFGGGASSAIVAHDRPAPDLKRAAKRVIMDAARRDEIRQDAQRPEVEAIIAQLALGA